MLDSINDGENDYLGYIFGSDGYGRNCDYVPVFLTAIEITNASEIDSYAIYNCNSLVTLTLSSSLNTIRSYNEIPKNFYQKNSLYYLF